MKTKLTTFTLFISILVSAQQKRILLKGKIKCNNVPISKVHIINKKTNIGTITNDDGFFEIPAKENDTLLISHIKYKNISIILSKENISKKSIVLKLFEKTTELNEITLEKQPNIIEQFNTIKKYDGPKVTAKSLGLPYTDTKPTKNETVVSLQSGGVVNLENLINVLNGNTRRKRIANKLSKEDRQLHKIRKHFTDSFFIDNLKIKKEQINIFLNFCIYKNIIKLFTAKEFVVLTKLFIKESKQFIKEYTIEKN